VLKLIEQIGEVVKILMPMFVALSIKFDVGNVSPNFKKRGFLPDAVVAHPAWKEAMFLKDIFPDA
jgi:hypothetical protein